MEEIRNDDIKQDNPFGQPKGTVRAILTLMLVLAVIVMAFYIISLVKEVEKETITYIMAIFDKLVPIATLLLGYYVGKK